MPCPCEHTTAPTYNCSNCGNVTPCPTTPLLPCPNPNPCDETFNADCIYFDPAKGLQQSCSGILKGDSLSTIIQKLDARICQCCGKGVSTSPLMVFYVDGNNTNSGDGSILNPFQTIDLAYTAVLGTGTIAAPQHQNVAVSVAAYNYTTSQNIYLGNVTYIFADGTIVNYTGTTYFIDTSVVSGASTGSFKITGGLNFRTSSGGFIRNEGVALSGGGNKQCFIEANTIYGNTNAGGTLPLIKHNMTSASGYGPILTSIQMKPLGNILSAWETNIDITNGGYFYIDLNKGQLGNGIDPIGGGYTGTAGRNLIKYNGASPGVTISSIDIGNGLFYSLIFADMVSVSGSYIFFRMHDIKAGVANLSSTKPATFMNIGAVSMASAAGGDGTFLVKNCVFTPVSFSTNTIITYTGSGTLQDVELQENIFHGSLNIGSNINPGGLAPTTPVAGVNIFRGKLHVTQLPIFGSNAAALSGGLLKDDLYTDGQGIVRIVY